VSNILEDKLLNFEKRITPILVALSETGGVDGLHAGDLLIEIQQIVPMVQTALQVRQSQAILLSSNNAQIMGLTEAVELLTFENSTLEDILKGLQDIVDAQ